MRAVKTLPSGHRSTFASCGQQWLVTYQNVDKDVVRIQIDPAPLNGYDYVPVDCEQNLCVRIRDRDRAKYNDLCNVEQRMFGECIRKAARQLEPVTWFKRAGGVEWKLGLHWETGSRVAVDIHDPFSARFGRFFKKYGAMIIAVIGGAAKAVGDH